MRAPDPSCSAYASLPDLNNTLRPNSGVSMIQMVGPDGVLVPTFNPLPPGIPYQDYHMGVAVSSFNVTGFVHACMPAFAGMGEGEGERRQAS